MMQVWSFKTEMLRNLLKKVVLPVSDHCDYLKRRQMNIQEIEEWSTMENWCRKLDEVWGRSAMSC